MLKPQTYMNRSGAALAPLRALPEFDPARDLLILVDDVALPIGPLPPARRRLGRRPQRAQEHRGRAAAAGLRPAAHRRGAAAAGLDDLADFVLAEFTGEERATLQDAARPMAEAVGVLAGRGHREGDDRFNTRT